jgi:uncharacterized protein YozE (UPF0346 family)
MQLRKPKKSAVSRGVETVFKDKRVGKKKRHFDELCEDTRFDNAKYRFRVSVSHRLTDTVTSQITQRFSATTELVTKLSILFPHVLSTNGGQGIIKAAEILQQQYSCDLTEAFAVQLVTFAASRRSQIITFSSVQQVAHLLIVEYSAMASVFTDVVTALLLFLILPGSKR